MKQNFPSTFNINQTNNFQTSYMLNLNANPFITSKPPKKTNNQITNTPLSFHPSQ